MTNSQIFKWANDLTGQFSTKDIQWPLTREDAQQFQPPVNAQQSHTDTSAHQRRQLQPTQPVGHAVEKGGGRWGRSRCSSGDRGWRFFSRFTLCEMHNLLPFPSPNQLNRNRKRANQWLQRIPKSLHFIVNVQNLVFHIETAIFE